MTGDYNSVIGMDKANPIHGFVKGYRAEGRFFPADEKITICGAFIETDDKTGLSVKIEPFQIWNFTYISHNIHIFNLFTDHE